MFNAVVTVTRNWSSLCCALYEFCKHTVIAASLTRSTPPPHSSHPLYPPPNPPNLLAATAFFFTVSLVPFPSGSFIQIDTTNWYSGLWILLFSSFLVICYLIQRKKKKGTLLVWCHRLTSHLNLTAEGIHLFSVRNGKRCFSVWISRQKVTAPALGGTKSSSVAPLKWATWTECRPLTPGRTTCFAQVV